jgi:hypothetical protein
MPLVRAIRVFLYGILLRRRSVWFETLDNISGTLVAYSVANIVTDSVYLGFLVPRQLR